jgi:hypothetical protein
MGLECYGINGNIGKYQRTLLMNNYYCMGISDWQKVLYIK